MDTSPSRPDSVDISNANDHQREQDAALAHSLRRQNTIELNTPHRERSSTLNRTLGNSPPRPSVDLPQTSGGQSSRRRGSSGAAANTLDHLADDLEIEAHQEDQIFFDRNATASSSTAVDPNDQQQQQRGDREREREREREQPSSASRYGGPQSLRQISSLQGSAAATRFYRQHRNLSDASIDSQGGAYIDHRRQPHSLSIGQSSRPLGVPGSVDRSGSGGVGLRSPSGYGSRPIEGTSRRQTSGDDSRGGPQDDMNDFVPYRDVPQSPASPSHGRGGSNARRESDEIEQSGFSSRTARGGRRLGSSDLDENAIADDDDDDDDNVQRGHIERHPTHASYSSVQSHPRTDLLPRSSFLNEHSRQNSLMGKPEEDVCFPAHGAAADVDLLDLDMSGMYSQHQLHHQLHHHHQDPTAGVPGILHNFPFPFDFASLEEYAEREKEGLAIPPARGRGGPRTNFATSPPNAVPLSSTSPPGYGTSMRAKILADGEGRKNMRQRKLSESVAPGRYQKNLALFEGAGDDMPPPVMREGGGYASLFDTKTPLLDKNGGAGGYGSNNRPPPVPIGGQARPYRFSFYSNALPSTIHARSLAEIPAEGQTFEELFVGRSTPTTDYEESVSGPNLSQPGTGGATTPVGGVSSSAGGNGIANGARPAGIPGGLGASKRMDNRQKSAMMRTDMDAEANTWWLDVLCPTDQEMKVLSKVFGIHPLTTEDIQMEETREKIELFRNYYFVCFRSFEQDPYSPTYLEPLNMYVIVFREGTLSFHFRGTPHPQNVRRRIKQLKDYINVTSDWISYALIDDITDAFGPLIQNIEYEVDSIDELVLILKEAEQSDMLRRIGTCRKKVMGLLRLMGNKADVVKGLSKRCNENWSVAPKSDIGLYLSDIQDHITTSTQNLTHYEKILSRSHSNYLAQISIEMTDANNQINDVLSKLTALGTVLIPMNLITGLWGMNVNVPGQGIENLHWFFSIVGGLGCIAIGGAWLTYRVFVRGPTK